jgi:hypothetical protein
MYINIGTKPKKQKKLSLNDNRIQGGLKYLVDAKLNNLSTLHLCGNPIASIQELEPLVQ